MLEKLGEQEAVFLAAGQRARWLAGLIGREKKVLQVTIDIAAATVDDNRFAVVGDILQNAQPIINLLAQLIEIHDLQLGAAAYFSVRGLQFAEQKLDERGLTSAVGADDTNLVAGGDERGKIPDHWRTVVSKCELPCFDHQLAGAIGLGGLHLHSALALAALAAFGAHFLERPHTAFIARAPRLNALADPHLFLREFLVELRVLFFFGLQRGLFAL